MSNSLLERGIFCAMVNRKTDPDIGDLHIAHDAVSCNVELVFVAFGRTKQHFVVKGILPDTFQHSLIVLDRLFPRCIHGGGVRLLQPLLIGHLDLGLVLFMVAGADDRVEGDAKRQQERDNGDGNDQYFSFRGDPPFQSGKSPGELCCSPGQCMGQLTAGQAASRPSS